jgi:hypothetical protein
METRVRLNFQPDGLKASKIRAKAQNRIAPAFKAACDTVGNLFKLEISHLAAAVEFKITPFSD